MLFKTGSKKYLELLDESGIFENSTSTAYPQTKVYEIVKRHLDSGGDKQKKVLIYGLDGARADSMFYLVQGKKRAYYGL